MPATNRTEDRASPIVPTHRTQSRAHSADVLGQLAKMRQQLNDERTRMEKTRFSEQVYFITPSMDETHFVNLLF